MTTPKKEKKFKEISHKVLGMNPNEVPEISSRKTFCDLCGAGIAIGDSMFTLQGENLWKFRIHVDCTIGLMTRMHNKEFREIAKARPKKKRTRQNKKHEHIGDGKSYCAFCAKLIQEEEIYAKAGKKHYHSEGRNSCYNRYQRVMNNAKNSLG